MSLGFNTFPAPPAPPAPSAPPLRPPILVRRRHETFASGIFTVLKDVHPDLEISRAAMNLVDAIILNTFECITHEALRICRHNTPRTRLTAREIQIATRFILPAAMSQCAVSEANEAVTKYSISMARAPSYRATREP